MTDCVLRAAREPGAQPRAAYPGARYTGGTPAKLTDQDGSRAQRVPEYALVDERAVESSIPGPGFCPPAGRALTPWRQAWVAAAASSSGAARAPAVAIHEPVRIATSPISEPGPGCSPRITVPSVTATTGLM